KINKNVRYCRYRLRCNRRDECIFLHPDERELHDNLISNDDIKNVSNEAYQAYLTKNKGDASANASATKNHGNKKSTHHSGHNQNGSNNNNFNINIDKGVKTEKSTNNDKDKLLDTFVAPTTPNVDNEDDDTDKRYLPNPTLSQLKSPIISPNLPNSLQLSAKANNSGADKDNRMLVEECENLILF